MNIDKEINEEMVSMQLSLEDEEFSALKEMGLKMIVEDDRALVEYAVRKLLEDYLEDEIKQDKVLDEMEITTKNE